MRGFASCAVLVVALEVAAQPVELPDLVMLEGHPVRTVLPPDAIRAIDQPRIVPASRAGFLQAEDQVLGVLVGGAARAYPIARLDWHEVVNDRLGGQPIAATW